MAIQMKLVEGEHDLFGDGSALFASRPMAIPPVISR